MLDGPAEALSAVEEQDDEVDELHGQIIEYLGRVSRRSLSGASTDELIDLMEATNNLEAIGDLIETNLISLGRDRLAHGYVVGEESRALIERFHGMVKQALATELDELAFGRHPVLAEQLSLDHELTKEQLSRWLTVVEPVPV